MAIIDVVSLDGCVESTRRRLGLLPELDADGQRRRGPRAAGVVT
jgi:hypothetical protein